MKNIKIVISIFCFIALFSANAKAQILDPKYEAVFIYNFTKYIDWPRTDGHAEFIIGILGNGDIVREMQQIAALKSVGDRKIVVKTFESAENIEHCHLLFITKKFSESLLTARSKLKGMSTLYITESPGMVQNGADINFIGKVNKIVFEINTKFFSANNLNIANNLLRLADKVYEN
jgi:hypothetical protein